VWGAVAGRPSRRQRAGVGQRQHQPGLRDQPGVRGVGPRGVPVGRETLGHSAISITADTYISVLLDLEHALGLGRGATHPARAAPHRVTRFVVVFAAASVLVRWWGGELLDGVEDSEGALGSLPIRTSSAVPGAGLRESVGDCSPLVNVRLWAATITFQAIGTVSSSGEYRWACGDHGRDGHSRRKRIASASAGRCVSTP
jgi:hypothetical protein